MNTKHNNGSFSNGANNFYKIITLLGLIVRGGGVKLQVLGKEPSASFNHYKRVHFIRSYD